MTPETEPKPETDNRIEETKAVCEWATGKLGLPLDRLSDWDSSNEDSSDREEQ